MLDPLSIRSFVHFAGYKSLPESPWGYTGHLLNEQLLKAQYFTTIHVYILTSSLYPAAQLSAEQGATSLACHVHLRVRLMTLLSGAAKSWTTCRNRGSHYDAQGVHFRLFPLFLSFVLLLA